MANILLDCSMVHSLLVWETIWLPLIGLLSEVSQKTLFTHHWYPTLKWGDKTIFTLTLQASSEVMGTAIAMHPILSYTEQLQTHTDLYFL